MEELITYTLTEQLSDGDAQLIMYAEPCQMPSEDGELFTIAYWYEHDNQVQYAVNLSQAIAFAKSEFEQYKEWLVKITITSTDLAYNPNEF